MCANCHKLCFTNLYICKLTPNTQFSWYNFQSTVWIRKDCFCSICNYQSIKFRILEMIPENMENVGVSRHFARPSCLWSTLWWKQPITTLPLCPDQKPGERWRKHPYHSACENHFIPKMITAFILYMLYKATVFAETKLQWVSYPAVSYSSLISYTTWVVIYLIAATSCIRTCHRY